jgi:hypothetical protein
MIISALESQEFKFVNFVSDSRERKPRAFYFFSIQYRYKNYKKEYYSFCQFVELVTQFQHLGESTSLQNVIAGKLIPSNRVNIFRPSSREKISIIIILHVLLSVQKNVTPHKKIDPAHEIFITI